jgi:hypothetical protein
MEPIMKTTLFALSCLTLFACATVYTPRVFYNYVEVLNQTGGTINNVDLQIGDSRNLHCDTVTKKRICYKRFGRHRYPQQPLELSWQDSAGELQARQLDPPIPATLSSGVSARVLLEINADGSVKIEFREDDFSIRS